VQLELGHTAATCQSTGDNLTVNFATMQLDRASVALEALVKGTCGIIRQATKAYINLNVKS
jgi:hypothetical protein